MFLVQEGGEPVDTRRPKALISIEPRHCLLHRPGVETALDGAADLFAFDQAGPCKHVEMLHHGRKGDRERSREIADRSAVLFPEPGQQGPPGRIGEGRKGAIEDGLAILNHKVKY